MNGSPNDSVPAPVLRLERVRLTLSTSSGAGHDFRLEADFACSLWPLVILGPSGAGKSLLMRVLAGLVLPESGRVVFGETTWCEAVPGRRARTVPAHRRSIGCCFQAPALFPNRDALHNVMYPLGNLRPRLSREERRARAHEELERWGAGALAAARVESLSGGEQGRVAMARAFAARPALLLLDEPFAALDPPSREDLLAHLRHAWRTRRAPAVWVTHDRGEALSLGGTMAILLDGRISQIGPPEEVFRMPASPEVASFVGVGTVLHGLVQAREGGVMRLRCGGAVLHAAGSLPPGTPVVALIRSEDVELHSAGAGRASEVSHDSEITRPPETARSSVASPDPSRRTSARNAFPAVVTAIRSLGLACAVDLDAGFPLSAAVTRPAVEDLRLEPGVHVIAHIKALAVQVRSETWRRPSEGAEAT